MVKKKEEILFFKLNLWGKQSKVIDSRDKILIY